MSSGLYPDGCSDPSLGVLVDPYVNKELSEEQLAAFEVHFFGCNACLEAIRVRQSGPQVVARWSDLRRTRGAFVWTILIGAVALAAAALLLLLKRS
jgi:hypothetical protein